MSYAAAAMGSAKFDSVDVTNISSDSTAVGAESLTVEEAYEKSVLHYFAPLSRQWANPVFRFSALKNKWESETSFFSSVRDICLNSNYQQIVGMGPVAIPLILNEMQHNLGHWFWALNAITGEDPVHSTHRGNISEMTKDWIEWGRAQGYLK